MTPPARPPLTPLEHDLAELGRSLAGVPGQPVALPTRNEAVVVRVGDVVVKAHAPGTDPRALQARLAAWARLSGIALPPLKTTVTWVGGRPVTLWPAGEPVTDPGAAPWEDAARLLAALHAVPLRELPPLPAAGGPARLARKLAGLDGDTTAAADAVRRAAARLPRVWEPPAGAGLTHGDWHLGQLVRHGSGWLLIDADDLGGGDRAWDLARPAAWFAAGLLDPEAWWRFLSAYRAAGGPALAGAADPWERLDLPARALTVQLAAGALAAARRESRPIDEVETALVDACRRIAAL